MKPLNRPQPVNEIELKFYLIKILDFCLLTFWWIPATLLIDLRNSCGFKIILKVNVFCFFVTFRMH